MTSIPYGPTFDIRTLGELAQELGSLLNDDLDRYEREDAFDLLLELSRALAIIPGGSTIPDFDPTNPVDIKDLSDGFYSLAGSSGVQVIAERHFTQAVKEMTESRSDFPLNFPEYVVIDWAATALNIRYDYSEFELDGQTYLIKAY